ncbi:MAG: putative zinc-binding protein [Thermodesulfobacteriota bacterium]
MADSCCAAGNEVMILACSGGSNVGQLSNQAAIELTQEGFGKMFCLAGIGGLISGFVQSARDVPTLVVVDGCQVGCARAILKNAGIPLKNYLVITDEGIEKNKNFHLERMDIDRVKAAVRRSVGERQPDGAKKFACECGGAPCC